MDPHTLRAKCRMLLAEYAEVFEVIQLDIATTLEKDRIQADSAFGYAKKTIRKEAMKEGITEFINKINKYASER